MRLITALVHLSLLPVIAAVPAQGAALTSRVAAVAAIAPTPRTPPVPPTPPMPPAAPAPRATWLDRYEQARQGAEQTELVSETITVGAQAALDLSNIAGDVRITGGSGSEIRIEATKRVRHRDADEARRLLAQVRVDITNVGGRVEVRTSYPRGSERGGDRTLNSRVDYIVVVPAGAAVVAKNISGDVSVERVNGEVRAETVSGDVTVAATPNLALAKSVSGDVIAKDIAGADTLTLTTISGTVSATGVKARALEAGSVSGGLLLAGVAVDRLVAKSVSGDIVFEAALAKGGRYEFNSHSGDVRLTLAGSTGFELNANSFSGSIRSDFPVTLRADGAGPASRDRDRGRRTGSTIRGSYGDSSAVLTIRTFSGAVVITRP